MTNELIKMASRSKQLLNKQSQAKAKAAQKNHKSLENPDSIAKTTTEPEFMSANTIASLIRQKPALSPLRDELQLQVEELKNGNSDYLEAILISQVVTLNTAFNKFLKQGAGAHHSS